jgi:hypothetical protein
MIGFCVEIDRFLIVVLVKFDFSGRGEVTQAAVRRRNTT